MFKPSKRDTSLCERDALRDMLAAERELLRLYAGAAGERFAASHRAMLSRLFAETSEDVCTVLTEAEVAGTTFAEAPESRLERERTAFSKEKKTILQE